MATVNVKDVAALAGVSVGTVSNVLNRPDRVSPDTLLRVNESIAKLGFVRNAAASQLRAGMSRSVGLVVLNAANPFFSDVARGAEDHAAQEGISVLVGNSGEDTQREAGYLGLFEEQRVRGVLITPVGNVSQRLERLRQHGIPTVLVDRQTHHSSFSSVAVDDVEGGRLAAGHLASIGRRRLAFIGGPLQLPQVFDRLHGAKTAARAAGVSEPCVYEVSEMTLLVGRQIGQELARLPVNARPDGVFAANDLLGLGLIQGLMAAGGIRVPDEIAVVGYDDIDFAAAAAVPLTSIQQHALQLGDAAMGLLIEETVAGPEFVHRQLIHKPEIIVRASTTLRA